MNLASYRSLDQHTLLSTLGVAMVGLLIATPIAAQVQKDLAAETKISAQTIQGSIELEFVAQGKVLIERGDQKLSAETVKYNSQTQQAQAQGSVVLNLNKDVFKAPGLNINLATQACQAEDVSFFYALHNGRGTAQALDISASKVHTLTQAQYTTCKPGQNDWLISAKKISIDENTQTGTAKNVVFDFLGLPILALPYFEFPTGTLPRTGLLPPSMGYSSGTGLDVSVPYYFNWAHNFDAIVNTRLMSFRGLQWLASGRYLTENNSGKLKLEWMPEDRVLGNQRWGTYTSHSYQQANYSLGWSFERVSDDRYLTDLSKAIGTATQSHLPAEFWYKQNLGWGQFSARAIKYQTLQDTSNNITPAYARLPTLNLLANTYQVAEHKFDFNAGYTWFKHDTLVEGKRLHVNPSWSWEHELGWLSTRTKVGFLTTQYTGLTGTGSSGASIARNIPTLVLDTGLTLERPSKWFNAPVTQTLEPRLYYLYVPFKEQSHIPVFDSSDSDFGFAQIFSENVFNGIDRIADANHMTAALSSRWIANDTSEELFKLTLGKRYYFIPQRVQLTGPSGSIGTGSSDWLFSASGKINHMFTVGIASQYDQVLSKMAKNSLTLSYKPQDKQSIAISKRFIRDKQDQIDLSWQWRTSSTTAIMGRVNYANAVPTAGVVKGITESLLGYEMDAGCWVFRIAANRYTTANNQKNTSIYFQIDFSGLSHVGAGSLDTIKRNVPGYTPFESKPTWSYDPFTTY